MEHVTFMYLRSMSFNQVNAILRSFYERNVFTKAVLIEHIEQLADRIPDHQAISRWLKPKRSGYYAIDGTWIKYRGEDRSLLILFDVKTLDTVAYFVANEETKEAYRALLHLAWPEISVGMNGFFCDGDRGLLAVLKKRCPNVPVQVCVFHKCLHVSMWLPFKRPKTELDRAIKEHVTKVLFAKSRQGAEDALKDLEQFAKENQSYKKLNAVLGTAHENFELLQRHLAVCFYCEMLSST